MNNKPLWQIRKEWGFTQAKMARKFGVTEGTYARQEKNELAFNPLSTLWRLALERLLQLETNNGRPEKPKADPLPVGTKITVYELDHLPKEQQGGTWTVEGLSAVKTSMTAD